jgi:RimJ/RimL family protein N-acetyltransferase
MGVEKEDENKNHALLYAGQSAQAETVQYLLSLSDFLVERRITHNAKYAGIIAPLIYKRDGCDAILAHLERYFILSSDQPSARVTLIAAFEMASDIGELGIYELISTLVKEKYADNPFDFPVLYEISGKHLADFEVDSLVFTLLSDDSLQGKYIELMSDLSRASFVLLDSLSSKTSPEELKIKLERVYQWHLRKNQQYKESAPGVPGVLTWAVYKESFVESNFIGFAGVGSLSDDEWSNIESIDAQSSEILIDEIRDKNPKAIPKLQAVLESAVAGKALEKFKETRYAHPEVMTWGILDPSHASQGNGTKLAKIAADIIFEKTNANGIGSHIDVRNFGSWLCSAKAGYECIGYRPIGDSSNAEEYSGLQLIMYRSRS